MTVLNDGINFSGGAIKRKRHPMESGDSNNIQYAYASYPPSRSYPHTIYQGDYHHGTPVYPPRMVLTVDPNTGMQYYSPLNSNTCAQPQVYPQYLYTQYPVPSVSHSSNVDEPVFSDAMFTFTPELSSYAQRPFVPPPSRSYGHDAQASHECNHGWYDSSHKYSRSSSHSSFASSSTSSYYSSSSSSITPSLSASSMSIPSRDKETDSERDARYDQFNEQRVQQLLPPKIYKTDIRRQYPRMFANVINGFDVGLMTSFHHQLATPNVKMEMTVTSVSQFSESPGSKVSQTNDDLVCSFHLQGRDLCTTYWSGLLQLTPNFTVKISNIKIVTVYGSLKCKLIFDVDISCSKMYAVRLDKMVDDITKEFEDSLHVKDDKDTENITKEVLAKSDLNRRNEYTDAITRDVSPSALQYHFDPIDTYRRRRGGQMPSLSPVCLDIKGKYILHVNEEKLIEKIEKHCEIRTITPAIVAAEAIARLKKTTNSQK